MNIQGKINGMPLLQNAQTQRPFIGAVVALTERPGPSEASEISSRVQQDYFPDTPISYMITDKLPENLSEESTDQLEIYRSVFPGTLYLVVVPSDRQNYRDQHIL
jgi:hypothetical protein